MNSFIQRHRDVVIGQLNGLDRIRFGGSKRFLCTVGGMFDFLFRIQVLLKDFKDYAMSVTEQIRQASAQVAQAAGRPVIYLPRSSDRKEDIARRIIQQEPLTEGLVCMLTSVEPCRSYHVRRNPQAKKLELVGGPMKCLHHYHYYLHPQLGLLNVRLQTWFPFTLHVCLNGREWLARQLDAEGIGYRRKENCFVAIDPAERAIFKACPVPYYGSVQESEWASDLRDRPEGVRIKHPVRTASIKRYDKQASVLRIETTVNNPRDIKVYRPKEGRPAGPKAWRQLRKGVADLHRRAQVCQAANDRYLEAMAAVDTDASLGELARPVCRPTRFKGQPVRGLNPLADDDARLLAVVARGEFMLHGFRNRDLRTRLYDRPAQDATEQRRRSAVVTRKLRLLRAHGLIRKVSGTHHYLLTVTGQKAVTALLAARNANAAKLLDAAA